jgi:hypothetical protein
MRLTNQTDVIEHVVISAPNNIFDDWQRNQRKDKVLHFHKISPVLNHHDGDNHADNEIANNESPVNLHNKK